MRKTCNKCGVEKSLEEFNRLKTSKDGRQYKCKDCERAYREANREKRNARNKAYREANRDKILALQKAWRDSNKDKIADNNKAYREANREKIAEYKKAYNEANRDKILAQKKSYREANKEKIADYKKAYCKKRYAEDIEFRTKCSLRDQTTRRLGEYKNASTIELVGCSPIEFWRRNGSPSDEELKSLAVDHIVPLSWFDLSNENHVRVSSHWTNLQYLGRRDNESKGDRYAGRPDAILGYRDEFDLEEHVSDMIEFLNETEYV